MLLVPVHQECDVDAIAREYLPRWEDFFLEPVEDREAALDLLLADLVHELETCEQLEVERGPTFKRELESSSEFDRKFYWEWDWRWLDA
jgi:hypothetical protein